MESKQTAIIAELSRRIASGSYQEKLPRARDLAVEFGVNVKTVDKAVGKLAAAGTVERRRRGGTFVTARAGGDETPVASRQRIEVIFEGFTTLFSHPFWRDIWAGMVEKLGSAGFRPVLNMLESDPATGLLKLHNFQLEPAAGRILLGVMEKRLIDLVRSDPAPVVGAGDRVDDPELPQVGFDFTRGIADAVDYLAKSGAARIGFIGQTRSFVDNGALHKFDAYRKAVQRYTQIPAGLIADTRPVAGNGAAAMLELLRRGQPDALIVANDTMLPEILPLLAERRLAIPVIGCDGLSLPGVPEHRLMVKAPLRRCGELAAEELLAAAIARRRARSRTLEAEFVRF